jgi:RNA polymerase sigma-70 factor (ECF subfamily)
MHLMLEIAQDTIMKAAQGDEESFEEIYRAYSGFVCNVAFRMVQDTQKAEEITQEVFVTVFRKLNTFQHKSTLKTWLYRITVNMSINYIKKIQKDTFRMVEYDETMVPDKAESEIQIKDNKEYHEGIIRKLLALLNPDQRACVVLRNIEGMSYAEVARSLNININTVRSRLKRAREKLLSLRSEVIHDEM